MSQKLIDHNSDLRKLKEEGFAVEIRNGFLLLHEIPYVNSACQIRYGILVSDLSSMAGDKTVRPVEQHVAYFIGEHPCNSDGTIISGIKNGSQTQVLAVGVEINHTFSAKPTPPLKYADYYEKMTTYVSLISSQAKVIDQNITEKPFTKIESFEGPSIFNYFDTNSTKAKISIVSSKLENHIIGIIGAGGTGSYVLDFVGKTPVKEIHLFDGDIFLQHNAFRSPGAPSIERLQEIANKADYFQAIYSNMRKNIFAHAHYINVTNIEKLRAMSFVFLCLDKGDAKKLIIDFLIANDIPFIDTGIGVLNVDDSLIGHIRTTTSTKDKRDHVKERIPFADGGDKNDYATNIQIAELNAMNAAFAVIKWKKLFGFYQDRGNEFNTTYSINDGVLINDDYNS